MNIVVHIDRLVLHGIDLPHSQRPRFQAAVEAELARLLTEGGLATRLLSGGASEGMDAGEIQIDARISPRNLAGQTAGAVYRSLGANTDNGGPQE
jgi:hypothetical protein